MEQKSLGQIAYEAYCDTTEWKSLISGAALPPWEGVKSEIKKAWENAGIAVEVALAEIDN